MPSELMKSKFVVRRRRSPLPFFHDFFPFSLTWDPVRAHISKRYSSLKSLFHFSKLHLNFLLHGQKHCFAFWNVRLSFFTQKLFASTGIYAQTLLCFFLFFFLEILTKKAVVNMGPYRGGGIFKKLPPPPNRSSFFFSNSFWIFFLMVFTKALFLDFWNFPNLNVNECLHFP